MRFHPKNFRSYLKHICRCAGAATWQKYFDANIRNALWIVHGSGAQWASTLQMNRNKHLSLNPRAEAQLTAAYADSCRGDRKTHRRQYRRPSFGPSVIGRRPNSPREPSAFDRSCFGMRSEIKG